jgi:hypothetical protein
VLGSLVQSLLDYFDKLISRLVRCKLNPIAVALWPPQERKAFRIAKPGSDHSILLLPQLFSRWTKENSFVP